MLRAAMPHRVTNGRTAKARRALHLAATARDRELLAASSPPPGVTTVVTNAMINTINTDVHTAETALDTALAAHQAIPARLPLAEVHPGQQVLDTESRVARGTCTPGLPRNGA